MTRLLAVVAALFLGAVTAGCSSSSSDSQGPPAVCSSVDALQTSVSDLRQVQVTANGLSALQDAVASVKTDLGQVKKDATSQYATQVDQLQTDFDAVQSAVGAAVDAPSPDTLGVVVSSIRTFADGVTGLAGDVRSTC
jgi:hypothetical protein